MQLLKSRTMIGIGIILLVALFMETHLGQTAMARIMTATGYNLLAAEAKKGRPSRPPFGIWNLTEN